jgi:deazaflavin-dependent oxidoreductase (nitroreductase family)
MPLPAWLARANRRITNPILGRVSDTLPPLATVHHVGRTSGRTYETPIMAFRQPGGFLVALTYGPQVQWLRNVEAAGGATIVQRRTAYTVGPPRRLHGADGASRLPAWTRAALRALDVSEFAELPDAPHRS